MVRLRVFLTLALALLLLGNGAWTPANHTTVPDSLVPEDLTAVDWQAIQFQVDKLTATGNMMGTEFRNAVAASSGTSVALDTNTIQVKDITMGKKVFPHYWYNVFAEVLIVDQGDNPVNKAIVYSEWSLNEGTTMVINGKTDKNGLAVLGLRAGLEGTWKVCVIGLEKSGWDIDESNLPWCEWIYVP
jgi:hypothetical protein